MNPDFTDFGYLSTYPHTTTYPNIMDTAEPTTFRQTDRPISSRHNNIIKLVRTILYEYDITRLFSPSAITQHVRVRYRSFLNTYLVINRIRYIM